MKEYRVEITPEAETQIKSYLSYILEQFQNEQAYEAVKKDYEETLRKLEKVAGSNRVCENPNLAKRGLRKMLFQKHDYVILYRIVGDVAEIVNIYHTLQDYEGKIY